MGYDDDVIVTSNNTGSTTTFYRINQNTGTYTTHSAPFDASGVTVRGTVDESGDVFFAGKGAPVYLYKIQPDDTNKYVADSWALASQCCPLGIAQTPRDSGDDYISFNPSIATSYLTNLNYVAHTCTVLSLGSTPYEPAKQNANITGERVYCLTSGTYAISYINTTGHSVVGLVTAANLPAPGFNLIIGDDLNMYIQNGLDIRQYDTSGNLLNSYTVTGAAGFKLACYTSESGYGYIWAFYPDAAGMKYWKVRVSDMTLFAGGQLNKHAGLNWSMCVGTRFLDQTSPVLFTANGADFYLGKMVKA